MKTMKKMLSLLMTLAMVCVMAIPAFAEGKDPSITIDNPNSTVSMKGHTYSAYKVMNLTFDGDKAYAYTMSKEFTNFFAGKSITTDTAANKYIVDLKTDADRQKFAAELLAYVKTNKVEAAATSPEATGESVTIPLKDLGYYLVADNGGKNDGSEQQKVVAALALTSTDYEGKIELKADAPTVEKKIVEGGKDVDSNNAAIGDAVNYKVSSKVPDMTGYTKYFYVVNDTLSKGLTFNDDVKITIGGATLTAGTDYTVTSAPAGENTAIKIVFKNFIKYAKDAAIVVTYSATLNENAVIGNTGSTNDVTLVYSNDPTVTPGPGDEPGPGDVVGETPKDTVITYATGVELLKVDNKGGILTGAEFEIEGTKLNQVVVYGDVFTQDATGTYYKLKDGSYTETEPNDKTEDKYESTTIKYLKKAKQTIDTKAEGVKALAFVDENGVLRFDGLAAGEYDITEIRSPDGYNLLVTPIHVTVTWTAPEDMTVSTDCKWEYALSGEMNQGTTLAAGGIIKINVVNQSGGQLPGTGGIGTTIFIVGGLILMIGAAVLLITKKRVSARR